MENAIASLAMDVSLPSRLRAAASEGKTGIH